MQGTGSAPPGGSADVVVVGGGGAGLAAAIEARAAGASVLLLEKNERLGGSTAWSVGSITVAATPHQRRHGIEDRPEDHWADMPGFAGALASRDNDALRRLLCEELPGTFRWLLESGIRFAGPMPEPPHRRPRMHVALPNSRAYIWHLARRAHRAGVRVCTGVRAHRLVARDGRVVGVETESGLRFDARRAVVLATGDFTSSPEFKARFMGPQEARIPGVNPTATGDGQRMAEALGARILNGDLALGPELRFVPPAGESWLRRLPPWTALGATIAWALERLPARLLRPFVMRFVTTALAPSPALFEAGALLVNRRGERFCDERERPAHRLADEPGQEAYIVLDAPLARRFSAWPDFVSTAPGVAYAYLPDYRRSRPDIYREAATLAALADKLGVRAATLVASVAERLREPPYVALGPVRPVFVHSEGGLAVDERHRVLDSRARPIPGLYAAGATGQGGLLLKGHGHHLAWAFVSGRRAGRFAALDNSNLNEGDRTQ
ncbi:MAG: FAD-dependent oxidoreductase [Burkholderiales bacterium]|nr:FAD-dependent oxidoreductase [Burkholderiales bacterium]